MKTRVIVGSRVCAAFIAVLGLLSTALFIWILTIPNLSRVGLIMGWVGTAFSAFAALQGAVMVSKPYRVTLDSAGFELSNILAKPRRVAWIDIEPIFVWRFQSTHMVAYRFLPGRRPLGLIAGLNAALGYDGWLSAALPMKAQALADLMNAYRAAALAGGAARFVGSVET